MKTFFIFFLLGFCASGSYGLGILVFILMGKLKSVKKYMPVSVNEWMPNYIDKFKS